MRIVGLVILTSLATVVVAQHATQKDIEISNNEYSGIVIGIDPKLPEDRQLLEHIKATFTEASARLYEASRHRAYYKEIYILVPTTWKANVSDNWQSTATHSYRYTPIRVADVNTLHGSAPYTKQVQGCGLGGEYIHLTPEFLRYVQTPVGIFNYGDYGKLILKEWSKLRYGVFDERGQANSTAFSLFYFSPEGMLEANKCSLTITGSFLQQGTHTDCIYDPISGLPDDQCRFYPDGQGQQTAQASIMSYPNIDTVAHFCDDNAVDPDLQHNPMAPNKHNIQCSYRSVSAVVFGHQDFRGSQNPVNDNINSTVPNFIILQFTGNRFILVMDYSGSMGAGRLTKMRQAALIFIQQYLQIGSVLGMVRFSSSASTIMELTELTSESQKDDFVQQIPSNPNGYTSIGSGLTRALQMLASSGESSSGAVLIVITDGAENRSPYIHDVLNDIIREEVICNTLAISDSADRNLENLAQQTGGQSAFVSESSQSTTYTSIFANTAQETIEDITKQPVELQNFNVVLNSRIVSKVREGNRRKRQMYYVQKYELEGDRDSRSSVTLDCSVGVNTQFILSYSSSSGVSLSLTPPGTQSNPVTFSTNNLVVHDGYEAQVQHQVLTVTVENAQSGEWKYEMNTLSGRQEVSVLITSSASDEDVGGIRVNTWLSTVTVEREQPLAIYTELVYGYFPVINAVVTADVTNPAVVTRTLQLNDNGAGADVTKGDGIYSVYFTQFAGTGRYSTNVHVNSGNSAQITTTQDIADTLCFIQNKNSRIVVPRDENSLEVFAYDVEEFERFDSPGVFVVESGQIPVAKPPSKIMDFSVEDVDVFSRRFTLQWTAPGEHLDFGTVFSYDLVVYNNLTAMIADPSVGTPIQNTNLEYNISQMTPLESGHAQRVEIDATASDMDNLVFAIRAKNSDNQEADWSNIVRVILVRIVPPTQIRDLAITNVDIDERTFSLNWTSPESGDSKETVGSFELMTHDSVAELTENPFNCTAIQNTELQFETDALTPLEPGKTQTLNMDATTIRNQKVFAFSIRSNNIASQWSNWSNTVYVVLPFPPGRITEFIARGPINEVISLQWVAPTPGDLNDKVLSYHLVVSDDYNELVSDHSNGVPIADKDLVLMSSLTPLLPGQMQEVNINTGNNTADTQLSFSVAAVNQYNMRSYSPVVSVELTRPTTEAPDSGGVGKQSLTMQWLGVTLLTIGITALVRNPQQ